MATKLKIAVSACFLHPDPGRAAFGKKTLHFVEQSMSHWLMSAGALPVMVPAVDGGAAPGDVTLADYAQWLDGMILHGGADVWPGSYGEQPLRPEWQGDRVRDAYEIALLRAFVAAGKPVLGICRGLQLINVAYGGSLYQDITCQRPDALKHRDAGLYDRHFHHLQLAPESRLAKLLEPGDALVVNSVHHQAIKDLAEGFVVEARCPDDAIIEAIRHTGKHWVAAVQWHPEFHRANDDDVIDDAPLLLDFLAAARAARSAGMAPAPGIDSTAP